MGLLHLALVHYPVVNRRGEIVSSAITNLDLHDLARTARTYGIPACFIVTPLEDQRALAGELVSHWCTGAGRVLHPDRAQALDVLRIETSVEQACRAIESETGCRPECWATSAKRHQGALPIADARRRLNELSAPVLLLLGTAWGLAPELFETVDALLLPIEGVTGYNHLSVRCAAAILVDRLLGEARA